MKGFLAPYSQKLLNGLNPFPHTFPIQFPYYGLLTESEIFQTLANQEQGGQEPEENPIPTIKIPELQELQKLAVLQRNSMPTETRYLKDRHRPWN